jgi:putative addiction module killer protein
MAQLIRYRRDDGTEPFTDWFHSIRDRIAQTRIRFRLREAQEGNLGDVRSVGEGVSEFRIHVGAAYRVYFGQHGALIVILLCGGEKRRQSEDIRRAKLYWREWKRRNP